MYGFFALGVVDGGGLMHWVPAESWLDIEFALEEFFNENDYVIKIEGGIFVEEEDKMLRYENLLFLRVFNQFLIEPF